MAHKRFWVFSLLAFLWSATAAAAQVYERTTSDGTVIYTDNPYEAGVDDPASPVVDMRGEPVVEEDETTVTPPPPAGPQGVTLAGSPQYGYTPEGLAAITVTVKNELPNAVTAVVVTLTLLDGAKEPLDAVTLRGPTGVTGRTGPGESLTLTGVANTPPDLIADQEVTTAWSNLQKNAPPPAMTPEPTPTPTPPLKREELPASRVQQKRILKQKYQEEQGKTP